MQKVLVIDDEAGPRESLRMVLKTDYEVLLADNVDRGMEILKDEHPDVVVMDIRMPGKTGIQGLQELRAIDRQISVIMLTGFGALETAQEAIRLGANDYLKKPFDIAEIQDAIARNVGRTQLERRKIRALEDLQGLNSRLTEELMEKSHLASIGEASAEFAHDLRNPLMIVTGYCDLLVDQLKKIQTERGDTYSETLEYLRLIEGNIKRCHQLADVWQKSTKQADLKIQSIPLGQLLREILDNVEPLTSMLGKKVAFEFYGEPVIALADSTQLLRALHNIISNSLHALPSEDGRIVLRCRRENSQARIDIKDNGFGIPAHLLDKVFDQHFTTKPPEKGTGLGLTITRKIVKAMQGSIDITSEEGKGTCVTIYLPLTS